SACPPRPAVRSKVVCPGPGARNCMTGPASTGTCPAASVTRTFMALRILVNDELRALDHLLSAVERGARAVTAPGAATAGATPATATWLRPGARIAIIAFHSLEDRRVKHAFADWERAGLGTRLTRKPVEADESESRANPRARSAKLRAFQIAAESIAAR
ncbi:MAG: 16S rRNA (cytosine(1402)-N(4))-methyltransferase, partial [Phycisphaerales bacterium]